MLTAPRPTLAQTGTTVTDWGTCEQEPPSLPGNRSERTSFASRRLRPRRALLPPVCRLLLRPIAGHAACQLGPHFRRERTAVPRRTGVWALRGRPLALQAPLDRSGTLRMPITRSARCCSIWRTRHALADPILMPSQAERDGYLPNVVYILRRDALRRSPRHSLRNHQGLANVILFLSPASRAARGCVCRHERPGGLPKFYD